MLQTAYAVSEGQKFANDRALVVVSCFSCHMLYAIPESLYSSAKKWPGNKPRGWKLCCPLGHQWWYTGRNLEEEAELARNEAARARAQRDQAQASARAQRGAATRARNERDRLKAHATAGVCPVDGCHRHFTNLERHIASKHPDYANTTEGTDS